MSDTHEGRCFCGAVRLEVSGPPIVQAYCHCNDCRAWSGTPVTPATLWPADAVRVTAGEEQVLSYSKTGDTIRKSCSKCGGALMAEIPAAGLIDVFAGVLRDFDYTPSAHVHYAQRMLDIRDGLPKFRDMPADGGGSGEMMEE
jgi:hypothetical protein